MAHSVRGSPGSASAWRSGARASDREAHPDPAEPGPEGPVGAPGRERPVGDHEGLLGDILGLGEVPEDAIAGPDEGRPFALHERPKRVAVAGKDGGHELTVGQQPSSLIAGRAIDPDRCPPLVILTPR